MELVAYDVNLNELGVVEGYKSLIYTERFFEPGEFSLVTNQISATKNLLPLNAACRLTSSLTLMIVENHAIDKDENGDFQLTVSGRTYESIFERRVVKPSYQGSATTDPNYTGNQNPGQIMYDYFIQYADSLGGAGEDFPLVYAAYSPIYGYPEAMQIGNTLDGMNALRTRNNIGVLALLLAASPAAKPSAKLQMLAYTGSNRYVGLNYPAGSGPVVFAVQDNSFNDEGYLTSKKGSYTLAKVYASDGKSYLDLEYNVGGQGKYGLDMRIVQIMSDIDPSDPLMQMKAQQAAWAELFPNIGTSLITGKVDTSRYKIYTDYTLGDVVTVIGNFGYNEIMRITEYTWSIDSTGFSEYPTLSAI